jgi:hypothetical protein
MLFNIVAAPVAYVSSVHYETPCVVATCTEIPHPDDDYLELWVNSITGGPNALPPVPQVNFTMPQLTPLRRLESAPDFTRGNTYKHARWV